MASSRDGSAEKIKREVFFSVGIIEITYITFYLLYIDCTDITYIIKASTAELGSGDARRGEAGYGWPWQGKEISNGKCSENERGPSFKRWRKFD